MTKYEFIFSNQRKHRIARHVTFWLVWSVAFNLLFHFPNHVFRGWDTSGPGTKNYQELGPALFFLKALIINSFLGVIAPQIALTYVLLYWLLPNYYYKGKNHFLTAITTMCVLFVFYYVAVGCKYAPDLYLYIKDKNTIIQSFIAKKRIVLLDQLNSLPIIIGFALMIKLGKNWWLKQKEAEQLAKEKTKAELQLLKAQVHPHFLFNTLNNIYFFTLTNSEQAPVMIKKLSGLLNYILNECNQPLMSLEKEIRMIEDYMALEKIRYGDNMQMSIEIQGSYKDKMIAPLLFIPFIENSFKHGASKMIIHPWVTVHIKIDSNRLYFIIKNSKPPIIEPVTTKVNIGLNNVKKRLELLYPGMHKLSIISDPNSYTIDLDLQLHDIRQNPSILTELKTEKEYAMA